MEIYGIPILLLLTPLLKFIQLLELIQLLPLENDMTREELLQLKALLIKAEGVLPGNTVFNVEIKQDDTINLIGVLPQHGWEEKVTLSSTDNTLTTSSKKSNYIW